MPRKKKLTPQQAKATLIADGIDFRDDFDVLRSSDVSRIVEVAKAAGYRKSKNAPGSTGRMFYQYLSRVKPVVRASGQLTPAERRGYQTRARTQTTKKSSAQIQNEINEALANPASVRTHHVATPRSVTRKTSHLGTATRRYYAYLPTSTGEEPLGTANRLLFDLKTDRGAIEHAKKAFGRRKFRLFSFSNLYDQKTWRQII